jgi:hypothetical protein
MWTMIYTAMDLVFQKFYYGALNWRHGWSALEESAFAAGATWLFALLRWHKADSAG